MNMNSSGSDDLGQSRSSSSLSADFNTDSSDQQSKLANGSDQLMALNVPSAVQLNASLYHLHQWNDDLLESNFTENGRHAHNAKERARR